METISEYKTNRINCKEFNKLTYNLGQFTKKTLANNTKIKKLIQVIFSGDFKPLNRTIYLRNIYVNTLQLK